MSTQEQLDAKRRRVSRACDTCRRKKVRCDGLQPSCTNCTTFGFQCTFNDSAKKRGPPKGYIEALENRLHRMENLLGGLVQTGERPKSDLDSWKEDQDDDLESADSSWVPHTPDTPATSIQHSICSPTTEAASISTYVDNIKSEDEDEVLPFDKDAREKINALSDSLDSMSLDDGGFIRYLGNSSGIDLLQKNQILRHGFLVVPRKLREHQDWLVEKDAAVAQMAASMSLPPRDLAEHLIETYFTYVHPNMPVLHKPTFMRQYRNPDPEKRPPMVLLNAMFAVASRFSDHPEIVGFGHDPEGFGDEYFARAKRLIDIEYELPRQSSIQALLLMVTYRSTSAKSGGRVWVMLGMATRMAQDMGMHRNSARWHLPPLETEIRKRLWWICYVMDRWVSASMGRPMAIDDSDCDVDYPSPVEQDWADADGNAPSPHENNDKIKAESSFALGYFVETIKLAQILGQILGRVYAATTRHHGPDRISSAVAELDTKLTQWLLSLPPELKYDHEAVSSGASKINHLVAMIHSSYYSALILLHRPYMVPTTLTKSNLSQSIPSLNICISAANSITHLTEKMAENDGLNYAWNFTTYEVLTSSLIHLTNSASVDPRLQAQARANLVKGITHMKRLGERWFNAAKFSNLLEDLMNAHLNFENHDSEGKTMGPYIAADQSPFYATPPKTEQHLGGCPIILRDQNHPSGGTLLFAPKSSYGSPQTTSSSSPTPNSSPLTTTVQNPESSDMVPEVSGASGDSESSFVPSSEQGTSTSSKNHSAPTAGSAQTTTRPMKKVRKPTSQRNSLLFPNVTASSPSPPMAAVQGTNSLPDQNVFTFSSLTTPGMFAQGQAFMDYEQMMAQQQLQMAQQQELQQLQSFSATPLFSSPLALQGRNGQLQQSQQQQESTSGGSQLNQDQKQNSLQQHQQQQYAALQYSTQGFGQQQGFDSSMGPVPQFQQHQQQSSVQPPSTTLALGNAMDGGVYNFNGNTATANNNNNSNMSVSRGGASAIPGVMEDYSSLPLFPQQDTAVPSSSSSNSSGQNPNLMAVPNPFFGIPNTIDWDEWNQYIASAGLQKF